MRSRIFMNVLFFRKMTSVVTKCTLENVPPGQEAGMSRFKQSLRQSMRRIRSSFRSKNRNSNRRPGSGRRPNGVDRNAKLDQANKRLQEQDFGREIQVKLELNRVNHSWYCDM